VATRGVARRGIFIAGGAVVGVVGAALLAGFAYKVTYAFKPPEANGFYRHTDQETGVPAWWQPFSETFTFAYPQK
jgi:uncharacterized protein involved in high-affinity Fe2+ transport